MKKVLIIGSGCSGLTAAIYISRASLTPVLIEGYKLGGQLIDTNQVENFPGFPGGVSGYSLIQKIKKQALIFGTRFLSSNVEFINFKGFIKKIYLSNGNQLNCSHILIAVGASVKFLKVYGEKNLYCNGVSTCATCDGFLTRNKLVAIVGGGDSACEEALFLSKIARQIIIVCRGNHMKASFFLKKKVTLNSKISFV